GADRLERLIEGARKEGSLSLYTSRVAEDTTPVIEAFTRKYGVDVQVWRASNRQVLQRVVQERRAGRCAVDVVSSGTPVLEPMQREQLLPGGGVSTHWRADATSATAAWRVGRHQHQRHLGRLQHQPGASRRGSQALRR